MFLTKSKGAVREFVFSDLSQAYNSDALTLLSQHLIGSPTDMVAQREASDQVEAYLYTVNSAGKMPVMAAFVRSSYRAGPSTAHKAASKCL